MRLPMTIDDAWRALTALAPARGELAGYTGTAVLEEADDDVHVAVFRLQGSAETAAATATLTTALAPASDGVSLGLELDLRPGPGAALTREGVLAALAEIVPAARAAGEAAVPEPAPPPARPPATPPASAVPAWSETVEWVEPGEPPPARPPARRSPAKGAVVAAGAAAVVAAWALRRRS
jgi:hypothetical protein